MPVLPLVVGLAGVLVVSVVVSLALGAEPLRVGGVWASVVGAGGDPVYDVIVRDLRAPRVVTGAAVGAGLALAGAVLQTLVRNPLADPHLLGVSSGASVGATLVIVTGALGGLGVWALSAGALVGAGVAVLLVLGVSAAQGGLAPLRLVLTGVVLSAALSAVSSFLVFASGEPAAAQAVLHWLLGSLSGATWAGAWPVVGVVVASAVALLVVHGWLDALAGGEELAVTLGVPVRGLRIGLFVLTSVLVGVLVAVSGGIGFVGLVVPHLARLAVGARHLAVLPVAALGGAVLLVWVDVAARVLVRPQEMPLSVVTGLVGAPVFLVLLGRKRYGFAG
ncbi:iron complex transport system permease protein [Actinosynnema pretiosum]|nr:iron complex transport system permease protein [Actinosynnema pretiosum]